MKLEQLRRESPLRRFVYWVHEREEVRLRRAAGHGQPWTFDPILAKYRFCNVRRMDDRVSQWLLHEWYLPNYGHPNILLACTLARFLNLPASLELVGFPKQWRPAAVLSKLRQRRDSGQHVFNGAYIVTGSGSQEPDKVGTVVNVFCQGVHGLRVPPVATWRGTWGVLRRMKGFGSFMAGQVTADLRWATDGLWQDGETWAPMGPGSKRGMNRLCGEPINASMNQERFDKLLAGLTPTAQQQIIKHYGKEAKVQGMEAIDWQNCLCEFDKYERTLWGEATPKQIYRPYEGGDA